jgi:NADH-quinone oxidoreductase subunit J
MGVDTFLSDVWGFITDFTDYVLSNLDLVAFLVLAVITVLSAVFVVVSKEAVHSALYLTLTFVCVAATYFFLEAEFIGVIQLMVYVGAITMMFAFSIMLTRRTIMEKESESE